MPVKWGERTKRRRKNEGRQTAGSPSPRQTVRRARRATHHPDDHDATVLERLAQTLDGGLPRP